VNKKKPDRPKKSRNSITHENNQRVFSSDPEDAYGRESAPNLHEGFRRSRAPKGLLLNPEVDNLKAFMRRVLPAKVKPIAPAKPRGFLLYQETLLVSFILNDIYSQ
jgi:hypothetical protein